MLAKTRDVQWGADLSGSSLVAANESVRQHFDGLYLIEIAVSPPDVEIEWEKITQPISGQPSDSRQVSI
jgi:hypothetical protein